MNTTRHIAVVCLTLALVACTDEPRELPFPEFEPAAPFDEPGAAGSSSAADQREGDDFERRVAESMRAGDEDESEAVKRQKVPLSSSFTSSIPLEYDEWQWASDGDVTLVVHRAAGEDAPDALVYAEGFSSMIHTFPSMEMRRFQLTADPALVASRSLPVVSNHALRELSEATGYGTERLSRVLPRAVSRTMGLGLNFAASEDGFGGWKWVGHNESKVELRLGRTNGRWLERPKSQGADLAPLDGIADETAPVRSVNRRFAEIHARATTDDNRGLPAWMLLGSATTDEDAGAHLAIMCKANPDCPVARELSDFLAELEPASGATIDRLQDDSSPARLEELADELDLPFVPADELPSRGAIEGGLE